MENQNILKIPLEILLNFVLKNSFAPMLHFNQAKSKSPQSILKNEINIVK